HSAGDAEIARQFANLRMITEQQQEAASLYALGALPADERRASEELLRNNAEMRELVHGFQRAAGLIALAVPSSPLPTQLREKVLRRLEGAAAPGATQQPGASAAGGRPGFQFHGAADPAGWKELPLPGAWIKLLSFEKDRGYAVLLGKLGPGVRYPAHTHF